MRARRCTVALLLSMAAALGLSAQQDPDIERGARPGLAYEIGGLDHVNLFNGTITLNVPLGPSFPVGGTLSYSFQASYGTNNWETETHEVDLPGNTTGEFQYKYPTEHSNAGFGWVVTLGALVHNSNGGLKGYLAPDGGLHKFHPTLHFNDPLEADNPAVWYTRDGTYLRMTESGATRLIDFPNGHRHTFNAAGRLIEMKDPYGNLVTLSYTVQGPASVYPGSTLLTITDSTTREHRIFFRPNWAYDEIEFSGPDEDPVEREMIHKIELAAFGGTTAVYTFGYIASPTSQNAILPEHRTSRRCGPRNDPTFADYVVTSLLSSITLPEGIQYSMDYDRGDQLNCSYNAPLQALGASGNLTKLVLPTGLGVTGGRIEWNYQKYAFPGEGGPSINAGILEKKLYDGTTVLSHTSYEIDKIMRTDLGASSTYYDVWRRVTNKDGSGTVLNSVKHYFTACRTTPAPGQHPCNTGEYGLPLTRTQSRPGGGFLSSEIEVPGSSARRRKWVEYESDGLLGVRVGPWVNANQRASYQATEYEDGKYADVKLTEFDGLGHYRKSVTGGSFPSQNVQTTFTNYNPGVEYTLNTSGNLSGFVLPANWLLTTFDKQWTSNGTHISTQTYCFDATGFLTSRRIFTDFGEIPADTPGETPSPETTDLLVTFTRSTAGNLTEERYYGGNATAELYFGEDTTSVAPSYTCGSASPANEAYRISHGYLHGVRRTSRYTDRNGNALSFYLLDADIDLNTGLIAASRRFSSSAANDGVITRFEYDLLGRMKKATAEKPAHTAHVRTEYAYQARPPLITVTDYLPDNTKLRESTATFDVLGRLTRETRSMPSNVTSARETKYNALGWTTQTTDWGATAPTVFSHDAFGRPTSIRTPDQTEETALQIAYSGISSVTRTSKVRTAGNTTTLTLSDAVTTEEYDRHGRLWRITEPAATVGGTRPVTQYTYDVQGRLTGVCANVSSGDCGQSRSFEYDNRGFLNKETHPENGTTTYAVYDARGHVRRRHVGSAGGPFDLGFDYDRAERLTQVHQVDAAGAQGRILKHFVFGTDNTASDLRNGRLQLALRFNWQDVAGTVFNARVVETYTYGDPLGGVSRRDTAVDTCVGGGSENCEVLSWSGPPDQKFEQTFSYDVLGNVKTLDYPHCATCENVVIGGRTITNAYDQGMLTSVRWTGAVVPNTFTYHPSGLVTAVNHDNGVIDETTPDPAVPSRPLSITPKNVLANGCVMPTFTVQPQSVTRSAGQVPLTAQAVGETGQEVMYQWYQGAAPNTSSLIVGAVSASYSPTVSATTSYWAQAWNDCSGSSRTSSVTATVTICTLPNVTAPADQTITRTTSVTLTATATGSPGLKHQWYTVLAGVASLIEGATTESITVSPETTTRYRVVVKNACNDTQSDDVFVNVAPPPSKPLSLAAAYNSGIGKNQLSWSASASSVGIHYYEIERHDGVTFHVASGTSFTDAFVSPGYTYVYRVRAVDMQGVPSDLSAPDLATAIVFAAPDPIPAPSGGLTLIRGELISELRQAVDAVRVAVGLPPAWSSYAPPTGQLITTAPFTQLRERLNEARAVLLLPEVVFTDPVATGQLIRRSCINDLRAGIQ